MTAHKRSGHGIFKARDNKNAKTPDSSAALPGILSSTPASPPASSPSPPTPSTASSATSSPPTASTSSAATASSTGSSSTTSSSATSQSSSSSASSKVSSTSATTKAPLTTAAAPTYTTPSGTNAYSYSYPALTTSTAPSATSSSSASIGGMSVGAIVGIVGGGLFGALILLMLGSYLLRWWRRHSAERDFVDEYNEPTPDFSPSRGNSVREPPMSQPVSSPSFGTGAGLAGQGIMATRAAMRTPGYGGGYSGYQNDDESISGAYSSQPQPQAPYNPEAYGAYVPYNGGGGAGYQEAIRGYQGQRAFEAPVNIGYAISEPAEAAYHIQSNSPPVPAPSNSPPPRRSISPTSGAPRTTASAALAAAKVAASTPVYKSPLDDQPRKSSTFSEQDAYGGF